MPKNKWFDVARLQLDADYMEEIGFPEIAKMEKTIIEKYNETRTMRIKGKNLDDLDLEKLGNLVQQATERSSGFSLKNILRKIQKSKIDKTSVKDQPSTTSQNV
jgi:hypothetical protein